jgi:hypothetical protein
LKSSPLFPLLYKEGEGERKGLMPLWNPQFTEITLNPRCHVHGSVFVSKGELPLPVF